MLLKGIKVLDLSTLLPGPMCSLFLADLGAEVIKIESPKGDLMRHFEPVNGKSPYFDALNRNKKSVVINLKTKEGKAAFMELAKDADVVIEGFRPGKVDALGVGYSAVKKINSKIVYCSITGYGQKGPLKDKAGHDLNYSALSGLIDVMSCSPAVPGVQVADVGCAIIAAFSIVSSLLYRERSGKGSYIDASIFNSALSLISIHLAQRSLSKNKTTILSGSKPCYNVYETKDSRYVSLGAIESKFWRSFCNAAKRQDFLLKQFDSSIAEDIKRLFKSKTMSEWLALNKKCDFCCEPVKNLGEVINDEYLNKNSAIISLNGVKQAGFPALFSSVSSFNYNKSPKLGEHNEEVLSKLRVKKGVRNA